MAEESVVTPLAEEEIGRNARHQAERRARSEPAGKKRPFPVRLSDRISPSDYRALTTVEQYVLKHPDWAGTRRGRWLKGRLERDPDYMRRYKRKSARANSDETRYQHWVSRLRYIFGLSVDGYMALLAQQAGGCAICGRAEVATRKGRVKRLAVDHDHATGVVRGLLCQRCNTILGAVEDDPEVLRRAILYLAEER